MPHPWESTPDDPPHVREDYREVWVDGYRAGHASLHADIAAKDAEIQRLREKAAKLSENWRAMAKRTPEDYEYAALEACAGDLDDLMASKD